MLAGIYITAIVSSVLIFLYLILSAFVQSVGMYIFGAMLALPTSMVMITALNLGSQDVVRGWFSIPSGQNDHWYEWLGVFIIATIYMVFIGLGYYLQTLNQVKQKQTKKSNAVVTHGSAPTV